MVHPSRQHDRQLPRQSGSWEQGWPGDDVLRLSCSVAEGKVGLELEVCQFCSWHKDWHGMAIRWHWLDG